MEHSQRAYEIYIQILNIFLYTIINSVHPIQSVYFKVKIILMIMEMGFGMQRKHLLIQMEMINMTKDISDIKSLQIVQWK